MCFPRLKTPLPALFSLSKPVYKTTLSSFVLVFSVLPPRAHLIRRNLFGLFRHIINYALSCKNAMILCFLIFTYTFSFHPNPVLPHVPFLLSHVVHCLVILSSSVTQVTQNHRCFSTQRIPMSRLEAFTSPLNESSLLPALRLQPVALLPSALSSAPLLTPFFLLCFSPSPPLKQCTPQADGSCKSLRLTTIQYLPSRCL